jgi:hypothetical protein
MIQQICAHHWVAVYQMAFIVEHITINPLSTP